MITIIQANATLSILIAFGVPQITVDNVRSILIPTLVATIPVTVIHTPIMENAPVYFGSVAPITVPTVIQQTPISTTTVAVAPTPKWRIGVDTKDFSGYSTTTVRANTGTLKVEVNAYDKNGVHQMPVVTVSTNDPDLPPSFFLNKNSNYFCVAPNLLQRDTCPVENPVSVGTFDFTFTVEDVSKTIQITVLP